MTEGHRLLFPETPHRLKTASHDRPLASDRAAAVRAATQQKDATRRAALHRAFGHELAQLQAAAGELRAHTLERLDHYLERFVDRALELGIQVHFAADAAQARAIVLNIAAEVGATRCVKSKSMVTEEIGLRQALAAAGVDTLETDLGELVLQLDDDAPSHIVTPMIHKDRAASGAALSAAWGEHVPPDPQAITRAARAKLRVWFETAELGVTGANFLLAEQGELVVCTNEGNGRWCGAIPKTHVAVVGIEKLLPDRVDLALMLKLLARSSTGQPLTVYTQQLGAPAPGHSRHVVLLDNGRTSVLASEDFRAALRCIRCGACLNTCPVYRAVGGHAYGSVYPGPIGAVLTPLMRGSDDYPDLFRASTLCGACHDVCPVDIPIDRLLLKLRVQQAEQKLAPRGQRTAGRLFAFIASGRVRFGIASRVVRWLSRLRGGRWLARLPGARGWAKSRPLPHFPRRGMRSLLAARATRPEGEDEA